MPYIAEDRATAVEAGTDAPRPRKEALLPQIAALALAGRSCRQIAASFGLPKSTVHRWLQALREGCPTRVANCAEMIAAVVADFKSVYREALESFHLSQADKETERIVETETARGPKKRRTVRRESRAGDPAFLAEARRALDGITKLLARVAPRPGKNEREKGRKGEKERDARAGVPPPQCEPIQLGTLPEGKSRNLRDEERRVVEAKCPTETAPLTGAAETPQPPSHLNPGDKVPQGLLEERGPAEESNLSDQRVGMGHVATAPLDVDRNSKELAPPVFSGFHDWHTLPLVETSSIIRGRTRRRKSADGLNCPIPVVAPRVGRARDTGRSPGSSRKVRLKPELERA